MVWRGWILYRFGSRMRGHDVRAVSRSAQWIVQSGRTGSEDVPVYPKLVDKTCRLAGASLGYQLGFDMSEDALDQPASRMWLYSVVFFAFSGNSMGCCLELDGYSNILVCPAMR